jgi:hypothetical protein
MSDSFIITFIRGPSKDLNKTFTRTPGTEAVIEVSEDNYDFLYNSLIEKATTEKRQSVR